MSSSARPQQSAAKYDTETRPIPGRSFEYDFYLDFTGSIHCPGTLELICALQAELPRFSFLGNYSEAGQE